MERGAKYLCPIGAARAIFDSPTPSRSARNVTPAPLFPYADSSVKFHPPLSRCDLRGRIFICEIFGEQSAENILSKVSERNAGTEYLYEEQYAASIKVKRPRGQDRRG